MHRNMQPAISGSGGGESIRGTLHLAGPALQDTPPLGGRKDPPAPNSGPESKDPASSDGKGGLGPELAKADVWERVWRAGPGLLGPSLWTSACAHFSGEDLRVLVNPDYAPLSDNHIITPGRCGFIPPHPISLRK